MQAVDLLATGNSSHFAYFIEFNGCMSMFYRFIDRTIHSRNHNEKQRTQNISLPNYLIIPLMLAPFSFTPFSRDFTNSIFFISNCNEILLARSLGNGIGYSVRCTDEDATTLLSEYGDCDIESGLDTVEF